MSRAAPLQLAHGRVDDGRVAPLVETRSLRDVEAAGGARAAAPSACACRPRRRPPSLRWGAPGSPRELVLEAGAPSRRGRERRPRRPRSSPGARRGRRAEKALAVGDVADGSAGLRRSRSRVGAIRARLPTPPRAPRSIGGRADLEGRAPAAGAPRLAKGPLRARRPTRPRRAAPVARRAAARPPSRGVAPRRRLAVGSATLARVGVIRCSPRSAPAPGRFSAPP